MPTKSLEEKLVGEIMVLQIVKKFPGRNPKFIAVFSKSNTWTLLWPWRMQFKISNLISV